MWLLAILWEHIESRELACRKSDADAKDTPNAGDTEESAACDNFYHAFLMGFILSRYLDTLSNPEWQGLFRLQGH